MGLTQKQLEDVCLFYQGSRQCRYLDEDVDASGNVVHVCLKKTPDKSVIDLEIKQYLDDSNKKNLDPFRDAHAMGDNCSGYLKLPNKKQGYDED